MSAVSTITMCVSIDLIRRTGCGDVEDIAANGGKPANEVDCAIPCAGDPIHLCGGAQRLQLYEWKGTPLNVWHKPAVTGRYEARVAFTDAFSFTLTVGRSSLSAVWSSR